MSAPVLETRDAAAFLSALRERLPGYLDGVSPHPGGPAHALLAIYARYLQALALRIDDAPAKNQLAFLDQLGIALLPAQAARAPVVFETIAGAGDGRAPAGTRLGAKGADGSLTFETERTVALAQARLAEVVTVWPGRDAYADHTAAAVGGKPFRLWDPLQPIVHELYVAHDTHLALAGDAAVTVNVVLARGGSAPLAIDWSWWDGKAWRSLAVAADATSGLTRSGAVLLRSGCAANTRTVIAGHEHFWVRGRLHGPFPPGAVAVAPEIDRLALQTSIRRDVALAGGTCSGGLIPEQAFADGTSLDLTKTAYPLGRQAGPESALYLACEEAFSRPGATVTVCVKRAKTAEDEADALLAQYELSVEAARKIVEQVRNYAKQVIAIVDGLLANELAANYETLLDEQAIADVRKRCNDALAALRGAAGPAQQNAIAAAMLAGSVNPALIVPPWTVTATIASAIATITAAQLVVDIAVALQDLSSGAPANLVAQVTGLQTALNNITADFNMALNGDIGAAVRVVTALPGIVGGWFNVALNLGNWPSTSFADATLPGVVANAKAVYDRLKQRVDAARTKLQNDARPKLLALDKALEDLSPITVAAAAGVGPPKLADPRLVWEMWTGTAWETLVQPSAQAAPNLLGDGTFTFTVSERWTPLTVNGVETRWLRARLASGSYARIRPVTWEDQKTKEIKFMAVVEPRPPAVDALRIGYRWDSTPAAPQRCMMLNDFRWADRTAEAAGRGGTFAPFTATEDQTPALYLGFDQPLPADLHGLLLEIDEVVGDERGPALEWQAWDGARWRRIAVEDETAGLALPGIAYVTWPGSPSPPPAQVTDAAGDVLRLADARAATRFEAGQLVWIETGAGNDLATIAGVAGDAVRLAAPLARASGQGTVRNASLPRFGTPRTWLRARLRGDGEPRRASVRTIAHNAVWCSHLETVDDELLGSSDGQPRQAVFFSRTPVLAGQQVEVRELEGPRAAVEYPMLVAALAGSGIAETDLRVVRELRSGAIREVWVPWRERPNLFFSGPADRDYTVERTRAQLVFGDGVHGRIPPAGSDNLRARRYRSGGGARGNVARGAISQVLSGVLVQGVSNPRAGEGGAEREPDATILDRGPRLVRSRLQAVTAADYETLAREASPAVAVARAIPAGRPGHVTVVIVPHSADPRPAPSFALRRRVREHLRARAAATLPSPPRVTGPHYLPVGTAVAIVPVAGADAGGVVAAVTTALERFLHPLTGGPDGGGWPFGRDVHASDVAAMLDGADGADGVDAVASLALLVDGSPRGDHVAVPPDRVVCAGPLAVTLQGADG